MIYDTVIVGGGPAGMSAALYLLRNNKTVLILEKENFGGQISNSPRLENYPSIKLISGMDFADNLFTQITDLGAEFELENVSKIEKIGNNYKVITNYNSYEARSVVIANGLKHRLLGLPKENDFIGNGISFCALCDGPMLKDKEAYIIGDANTAMQYALLLVDYCKQVHMFLLFDHYFGDKALIDKVLNHDRIDQKYNMNLVQYLGEDHLTGLVFENTKDKTRLQVETDNLFLCIGQMPENDRFTNLLDLDEKGYILTDENMCCKTPGVFAIGDTRKKAVKQVVTACNDGAVAAISLLKYLDN